MSASPASTSRAPALVLMTVVLVWSAALAVGFAFAAAGSAHLGTGRVVLYVVLSAFTALLAARTGYEMVRKILKRG